MIVLYLLTFYPFVEMPTCANYYDKNPKLRERFFKIKSCQTKIARLLWKHMSERLKKVGSKIRAKLKAQGYTLEAFANEIGITTSTMGRIVKGAGGTINVKTYEKIADALGVEWEELLNTQVPLHLNLTGFAKVDELISMFFKNLYNGDAGYEELKEITTTNYKLRYLYNNLISNRSNMPGITPSHAPVCCKLCNGVGMEIKLANPGMSLVDEMRLNAKEKRNHEMCKATPVQAWPLGCRDVLVHVQSICKELEKEERQVNVPMTSAYRYISTIEVFTLDTAWANMSDKPIKIEGRIIGIINIRTNNRN